MPDARYKVCEPEVALETFDGDAIVIDFRSGSYYALSPIASEIVIGLAGSHSAGEIAERLARRYPAAAQRVATDVAGVLDRLLADGVLMATDATPPTETAAGGDTGVAATGGTYEPPTVEHFSDMQEMLLLDPIHEVDLQGWPVQRPADDGSS